jgi:hypothetical protein
MLKNKQIAKIAIDADNIAKVAFKCFFNIDIYGNEGYN